MITVGISTLHGELINLDITPSMAVSEFKQLCIDASPFHLSPLGLNVDLAYIMKDYIPNTEHEHDGMRVVHYDGDFLDDEQTIESQVSCEGQNVFLFKLVTNKRWYLSSFDYQIAMRFHNDESPVCVRGVHTGTKFLVKPVWGTLVPGGKDRIVSIFYEHPATDDHCYMAQRGVDPRRVSTEASVF